MTPEDMILEPMGAHRWVWGSGFGNLTFVSPRWVCIDCHTVSDGEEKGYTGNINSPPTCYMPKQTVDPRHFVDVPFPRPSPEWSRERPTKPGWYWFVPKDTIWPDFPFVVRVTDCGSLLYGNKMFAHEDGALYAGPLTPPPLPEGTK